MDPITSKSKRLWQLFSSMFYISSFTFGGGFVIITFMKHKFVDELHCMDEQEMLDFTALAQSSPGAIAVNAAILVGWRMGGLTGMLAAVLGTILPPMLILSVVSMFYTAFASNHSVTLVLKGMQAGVSAVILDVVCSLGGKVIQNHSLLHICMMVAVFCATFFFGVNVIYMILCAGIVGMLSALDRRRRRNKRKVEE